MDAPTPGVRFSDSAPAWSSTRCRVATPLRVEERDHGGLGLRRRGERIGLRNGAYHKKRKNEREEDGGQMLNKIY